MAGGIGNILSGVGNVVGGIVGAPIAAVASVAGGIMGKNTANKAASEQVKYSEQAIAEQQRQFDYVRDLLQPFVDVGAPALEQQKGLLGLSGPEAQQQQITALEQSPMFQALVRQQEQGLLQNASATGGLRGGNIQAALAQFRPAMLRGEIENQYSKLAGLTALGQQSATGVGANAMDMAGNVSSLLTNIGAARAGAVTSGANAMTQGISGAFGALSNLRPSDFGLKSFNPF